MTVVSKTQKHWATYRQLDSAFYNFQILIKEWREGHYQLFIHLFPLLPHRTLASGTCQPHVCMLHTASLRRTLASTSWFDIDPFCDTEPILLRLTLDADIPISLSSVAGLSGRKDDWYDPMIEFSSARYSAFRLCMVSKGSLIVEGSGCFSFSFGNSLQIKLANRPFHVDEIFVPSTYSLMYSLLSDMGSSFSWINRMVLSIILCEVASGARISSLMFCCTRFMISLHSVSMLWNTERCW